MISRTLFLVLAVGWTGLLDVAADALRAGFREPPDSARPGVYWYFMDGNLSREGMTRDLESMKAAGMGHLVFLEVNVGVPRGPVDFLSEPWQALFVHAVREAERLGIEITLGVGPGWTGSGGPWVKPEASMQHLVASRVEVSGPGRFEGRLPVPPPRRPFFGDVPPSMRGAWESFFRDVSVLAFPTPAGSNRVPDIDEKALVYRAPFSSQPGVRPRIDAPAEFSADVPGSTVPRAGVVDLTDRLGADGSLDWRIPEGRWTVMRFVSRNNGASTRPAPDPGIGFECDKFDAGALDAHFREYVGRLVDKVGPRKPGVGWTLLHMDSWEMGAQNWTPRLREEFTRRRGYDPQPFLPAYTGMVVDTREITERFLWDLRMTGQELVLEHHAGRLKELGRRHGFGLSIEPYDMNPLNDFDLGAVADVPMCEFWSLGFDTSYSCHEAASIAHVLGLPIVAAEAFTADHREAWRYHPGSLKNQGDWAFATGINRLTYHTFAHKPDEGRPGMVMGPYGVHWDRGQTWWPMVGAYHRYISRCQQMLRQGRPVADVLYLMPEGAPNIFQPPASAATGEKGLPDRRGYNFDGCSADVLRRLASARDGRVVFPGGASYRLLVLPNVRTMTPELARALRALVQAGATLVGNPPVKSPSLVNYPECDEEVARVAREIWGGAEAPETLGTRRVGLGRVFWGGILGSEADHAVGTPLYPEYDVTAGILREDGVAEDFSGPDALRYTHRRLPDREVYFVANRTDRRVLGEVRFRVARGRPEYWDPQDGTLRGLPRYSRAGGVTTLELQLEPYESGFVVFPTRRGAAVAPRATAGRNTVALTELGQVGGPWEVRFDPSLGGPDRVRFEALEDWSQHAEPGVKFYSGLATYRTTFELSGDVASGPVFLDLGRVEVMARVRVNGTDCGVVWTAPWRVNVRSAVNAGTNVLEIDVANLWPNRMIGDASSPGRTYTQTTYRPYTAADPLLPSGLLGPVRLLRPSSSHRD